MIARAAPGDAAPLVEVALAALADDPLHRWLCPEPRRRHRLLRGMFTLVVERGLAVGEVWTDRNRRAVAVWTPPGVELLDERSALTFEALLRRDAPARIGDVAAGMAACDEHRPPGDHWFLHSLAVRPPVQGQGLGASLLRAGLEVVDADGTAAALDTSNPRNRSLYERHGFEAVATVEVAASVAMRPMRRLPA